MAFATASLEASCARLDFIKVCQLANPHQGLDLQWILVKACMPRLSVVCPILAQAERAGLCVEAITVCDH